MEMERTLVKLKVTSVKHSSVPSIASKDGNYHHPTLSFDTLGQDEGDLLGIRSQRRTYVPLRKGCAAM